MYKIKILLSQNQVVTFHGITVIRTKVLITGDIGNKLSSTLLELAEQRNTFKWFVNSLDFHIAYVCTYITTMFSYDDAKHFVNKSASIAYIAFSDAKCHVAFKSTHMKALRNVDVKFEWHSGSPFSNKDLYLIKKGQKFIKEAFVGVNIRTTVILR